MQHIQRTRKTNLKLTVVVAFYVDSKQEQNRGAKNSQNNIWGEDSNATIFLALKKYGSHDTHKAT